MDDLHPMTDAEKLLASSDDVYIDRGLSCNLALWAALVGVDGVFVGAAAIIAGFGTDVPVWPLLGILGCCTISLLLLLLNFYSIRLHYYILSSPAPKDFLTDDAVCKAHLDYLEQQKGREQTRRKNCTRRENVIYFLLALTVILIAVCIYTKSR